MKSKLLATTVAAIALTGVLSACTGGNGSSDGGGGNAATAAVPRAKPTNCTNTIVTKSAPVVTVWAWYPGMAKAVDDFNLIHTDVQVCWTNAGQGTSEYSRLRAAVSAQKGAPDVVQLETDQLPGFEVQDTLVDLSQFGADEVRKSFSSGAWKDVSQGAAVYAIPVDGGPMAMVYRKDVFAEYGITRPPATWDAYAADAARVKAAGGPLFGDVGADVPATMTALMAQKGAVPFLFDPADKQHITIALNSQPARDVLNYWANMAQKGLVGTQHQLPADYLEGVVAGRYATYVSSASAAGQLTAAGAVPGKDKSKSKDKTKAKNKDKGQQKTHLAVAPLPQWDAAHPVSVNRGGSAFAVTTQAADKAQSTVVAKGLFTDASLTDAWKAQSLFPLNRSAQTSRAFVNDRATVFDGQTANKDVYLPAAQRYQGSASGPFTTYYETRLRAELEKMNAGKATGDQAADELQADLVAYAKRHGFTVS